MNFSESNLLIATLPKLIETIEADIHTQAKHSPHRNEIQNFVESIWKVLDPLPISLIPNELKQVVTHNFKTQIDDTSQQKQGPKQKNDLQNKINMQIKHYFSITVKQLRLSDDKHKFFTPNDIQQLATSHQFEYTPESTLDSLKLHPDRWRTLIGIDWEWQILLIDRP